MNGRVGEWSEFSQLDKKVNTNYNITRSIAETSRRNCDKETNNIGENVIHLCKSYDMQIANGRMRGDFLGTFTHHNKNNGQSVVGLALLSDCLYPYIEDFKVLPQPEFSDHCKIVLIINNMKPIKTKQKDYKWLDRKHEYKWDKDSPEKFQAALNSQKVKAIIDNCKQRIEAGLIESSGELLQKMLQKAADLSKKKTRNISNKLKKNLKKWFDKDCIKLRSLANKTAISKHKQPWNKVLQDYHRNILKEFKTLCRAKKNKFWQNEITKINNIGNEDNFGEKWKRMGKDLVHGNTLSNNLDGQKWENHFKILFQNIDGDTNNTMKKLNTPINKTLNEKFTMGELKHTIK